MILHLCVLDKFIAPFYEFVQAHFDDFDARHRFYINGKSPIYRVPKGINIYLAQNHKAATRYAWLIRSMNSADKIILHGLWDMRVLMLLTAQPWLLKKCYWVIWGGDLYTYKLGKRGLRWWRNEILRRFVIKRIGHFITHIKGDYDLAEKWYGAKGEWHECFMYPSNLYQEAPVQSSTHAGINILLGNSADPSNNHIEVLEKLKSYAGENIKIYCPLSYGDQSYAHRVSGYGGSLFGEKFIPLRNFMPIEEYNELLAKIDIAIFNHKRQQGMGNIVALLGLGKKVYLRNDITTVQALNNIGLIIGDINEIQLTPLDEKSARQNKKKISIFFSRQNLVKSLESLFSA